MKTLGSILALALTAAVVASPASARTSKKSKTTQQASDAVAADLDRRAFYDDDTARHLKSGGDRLANRYDLAVFVNRAFEILANARGGTLLVHRGQGDASGTRALTEEMHGEAGNLADRLDRLTGSQKSLHQEIEKLRRDRKR